MTPRRRRTRRSRSTPPPSNGLAVIKNLGDVTTTNRTVDFKFTYTDVEAHAMSNYRVKVFSDSGKTTLVHDSGDVTGSWATGTQITYAIPNASAPTGPTWHPSNNTDYWIEVTAWDSYSTPGSGSDTHQFRIRWGDMALARYVGAGATSLVVTVTPAAPAANTQRAIWYRLADNAWNLQSVASPWVTSTGSLPPLDATYAWLQVYTRIASDLSGTNTGFNNAAVEAYNQATGTAMDSPETVAQALLALIESEAAERFLGFPERLAVRLNGVLAALLDGSFARHRRSVSPAPLQTASRGPVR